MIELPNRARAIYQRADSFKQAELTKDLALLGARVALAWLFIYHGARTLFGAFGGPGVHQASIFYGTVAHLHPAVFFAVLGGIIEFSGGIAIGFGIFGRLAAAAIVGDMAMAMITVTWANGIASDRPGGGYELNLALAALAFVVALFGTGRVSLDLALRRTWDRRSPQERGSPGAASDGSDGGDGSDVEHDRRADRVTTA